MLNFGVAPGLKDKFVQSFVESAIAAGLASVNEDGQIVLTWAIDGGSIVFEIWTDKPLPATAFTTVGEVVASLEHLAATLGPLAPQGGVEAEGTES